MVVFLLKTITLQAQMERLRIHLGFDGKFVMDKEGKTGALYIFWSNDVDVMVQSYNHLTLM